MNLNDARKIWGSMMDDKQLEEWVELTNDVREHDTEIPKGATIVLAESIDTRRAMGLPPGKLLQSDLVIKPGIKGWYVGRPFTYIDFIQNVVRVDVTEEGDIWWHHGLRTYHHSRPNLNRAA